MRIAFTVNGRPPRKHGEKSMWARDDEAPFIVKLRKKAYEARSEAGLDTCFDRTVGLEVTVYVPTPKLESVGDLDTFVAGICDALQTAHPSVDPHSIFGTDDEADKINPGVPILVSNDRHLVSINARKQAWGDTQEVYYTVVVDGHYEVTNSTS